MARILIADDNSLVRWTLATLLQSQGHDVDLAVDGQQALHHFTAHPADMVVLDVHMPDMDGLETCQRIRRGSAVPILVLSTLDHALVREQALSSGADAFLLKPLEVADLLGWVRALCGSKTPPPTSSGQPPAAAPGRSTSAAQQVSPKSSRKRREDSAQTTAYGLPSAAGVQATVFV